MFNLMTAFKHGKIYPQDTIHMPSRLVDVSAIADILKFGKISLENQKDSRHIIQQCIE